MYSPGYLHVQSAVKLLFPNQDVAFYLRLLHKPKHPTKVHVYTGISKRGKSWVYIFEGIMRKGLFANILEETSCHSSRSLS